MSRERNIEVRNYYGKITGLINSGVCSRKIDKCKNARQHHKNQGNMPTNIPYCHLYQNENTQKPCRQGAVYGCREYHEPRSSNNELLTACEHKNNIDENQGYVGRIMRQPSIISPLRSNSSTSRSNQTTPRRQNSMSRRTIRKSNNRMTLRDKENLKKNYEALRRLGLDSRLRYEDVPKLGDITNRFAGISKKRRSQKNKRKPLRSTRNHKKKKYPSKKARRR